jgi:hypothetical protein
MSNQTHPATHGTEEQPSSQKQNNPFSEQEKYGDQAERRGPGPEREYQGGQPRQPVPGVEGDTKEDQREKA